VKRALLIGSQTGGLTGVHADIEVMNDALTGLGFTTMPSIEKNATANEIVARYRGLIEDTGSDDAAVIYYSGHGGRQRNPLAAQDPALPTWLQYLVPTDYDDRSEGRARCVLAEELTRLQLELTDRTRNVTVILDCCHAARMSRNASAIPKANDQLDLSDDDLVRRWQELRAGRLLEADANPHAVRVVASAPEQSAFETYDARLGHRHGGLTAALVPLLTGVDVTAITWLDALEVIRTGVCGAHLPQRPEIEGPADRLLFSLNTRGGTGVLPVRVEHGTAALPDAAVFGITVGDRYHLVAPGTNSPVGSAVVARIIAGDAVLTVDGTEPRDLPTGTAAWPVDVALTRRSVVVLPTDDQRRDRLIADLAQQARVRFTEGSTDAVATLHIEADAVRVFDAAGQPLYAGPVSQAEAVRAVRTLAMADHVRELPSGIGDAALPTDVQISYVRALPGGGEVELTSGEHLFIDDRLFVRITNTAGEMRYASVFDVGLAGAVSQLTSSEPSGVTIEPGEQYELGHEWSGGMPLRWADGLPADEARLETFKTVIADRQVDRLSSLGQPGVTRRTANRANALERLVDDLAVGRRDVPRPGSGVGVHWRTEQFDFLLHPVPRPASGEPAFEIDERPDPSFRLLVPRGPDAPGRVAVRLKELTVHSNRAFLKSRVRVDAMVITAAVEEAGGPYRASTMRFDRITDGDRLPFDDVLIYEGPVARFLDLAVWVARDGSPDVELAELLAAETGAEEVATAITTLVALAAAAPAAAAVAGSVAAVAVLVRTAARLIDNIRGSSIGVYRTSLLPHQQFGAGDGIGRHPAQGLLRAQDMSFAFEVVSLDR
jgi:hypothetical protein